MDGRPAQNPDLQSSLAEFFMTKKWNGLYSS